jgi:fatty acid desaturase
LQIGKDHYYAAHTVALRRELSEVLPREQLRDLHQRQPWRHFLVLARQLAIFFISSYLLIRFSDPWIWVPLAFVQGLTIFNFTVMLHEVVHRTAVDASHERINSLLGFLYAFPSGISCTQFTKWHLDHHAELGSDQDDPKRNKLSPKVNRRWYKLLYFSPALFPIYFRAARKESSTYPPHLQRRISIERNVTILAHLLIAALIGSLAGWYALLRVYIIPYFFIFPIAFAVNRLGQHYDIDPADPAKWSTRMKRSIFWDAAYLWSGYHLEHHYFPNIPFYNLRRLNKLLEPMFERHQIQPRSYARLLYLYLIKNKKPHSDWDFV